MPRHLCIRVLEFSAVLALILIADVCAIINVISGVANALSSGMLVFYAFLGYSTDRTVQNFTRAVRAVRTWRQSQYRVALRQADRRLRILALLVVQSALAVVGALTFDRDQGTLAEAFLLSTGLLAMIFCWCRFLRDAPSGCI